MTIKVDKNINDNSIKHSTGIMSMDAIIGNIACAVYDPVKHKRKQVYSYMQAFFLDLIRSISSFEFFLQPLKDLEAELQIWEFIKLKTPNLSEINIKNLIKIHIIYNDNTTPDLLA